MITLELTPDEATRLLDCIILPTVAKKLSDAISAPPAFVLRYETDNGYKCSCCRHSNNHKESFDDINKLCAFIAERELLVDGDYGFSVRDIVLQRPELSVFSEHRELLDQTRAESKRRLDLQVQILGTQYEIQNAESSLAYMRTEYEELKPKLNAAGQAEYLGNLQLAETTLAEMRSVLAGLTPPELSEELMNVAKKIAYDTDRSATL